MNSMPLHWAVGEAARSNAPDRGGRAQVVVLFPAHLEAMEGMSSGREALEEKFGKIIFFPLSIHATCFIFFRSVLV
jgi:hypothetical protein